MTFFAQELTVAAPGRRMALTELSQPISVLLESTRPEPDGSNGDTLPVALLLIIKRDERWFMRKKQEGPPVADGMALISQAKAAEMCGMTREAIHNLVRRRRFRSVEVEGRALVYLKEVEAFEKEDRHRHRQ